MRSTTDLERVICTRELARELFRPISLNILISTARFWMQMPSTIRLNLECWVRVVRWRCWHLRHWPKCLDAWRSVLLISWLASGSSLGKRSWSNQVRGSTVLLLIDDLSSQPFYDGSGMWMDHTTLFALVSLVNCDAQLAVVETTVDQLMLLLGAGVSGGQVIGASSDTNAVRVCGFNNGTGFRKRWNVDRRSHCSFFASLHWNLRWYWRLSKRSHIGSFIGASWCCGSFLYVWGNPQRKFLSPKIEIRRI